MSTREPLEALFTYKDREQLERIKWHWINMRRIEYSDAEWIIGKMYALAASAQRPFDENAEYYNWYVVCPTCGKGGRLDTFGCYKDKPAEPIEKNIATISKPEPASTPAPEGIQHPDWTYNADGKWVRKAAQPAPQSGVEEQARIICEATKAIPIDHRKGDNCPRCDAIEAVLARITPKEKP